jgi:hypothetical protein
VVGVQSAQGTGIITIHQGAISRIYAGIGVEPGNNVKAIRIPGGDDFRLSTYKVGPKVVHLDERKFNFSIRTGTITYIGDIIVDEQSTYVILTTLDREADTVGRARRLYPQHFAKFQYEKRLLAAKVE